MSEWLAGAQTINKPSGTVNFADAATAETSVGFLVIN